jgi:hypothetical protein
VIFIRRPFVIGKNPLFGPREKDGALSVGGRIIVRPVRRHSALIPLLCRVLSVPGYNPPMPTTPLNSHPSTPCELIRRFTVSARKTPGGILALEYTIEGEIAGLRLPEPSTARRADGLWRHTCFEAFLMQGQAYYEFNFAPSSEWAVYHFEAYRDGMSVVRPAAPPKISLTHDAQRLVLNAEADLDGLSVPSESVGPKLALSAVIEEKDGGVSYWAIVHPSDPPDFHHPDGFALLL